MRTKIESYADDVPDHAVAHLPDVVALVDLLAKAKAEHVQAVRALTKAEADIAAFHAEAVLYERQVEEHENTLRDVALGCVLGDAESEKRWADAESMILLAHRFLKQHKLATPAFESWARPAPSIVASLARKIEDLGMELAEARQQAKLELENVKLST